LATQVRGQLAAILKLERPYNPGLSAAGVPVDAVTTSGSGIDPDISPANARLQSRRIAAVRHLPLSTVDHLISRYTDGRSLGFLGEPGVNVLELNLALDRGER
jgi:K+-transporting ATPase ATPase C chain